MTVNFALLGAGRIGKVHAKAIAGNADARLVAVADAFAEAAQAIADAYGCAVRSIEDVEADKSIDAVVICTPTDTHADLIERFARAGKAVFCEKPIDLNLARVKQCLGVVKETGAVLMVGFNRRFDPHFAAVRAAIDEGRIGPVEMVQITSRDPGPPPISYIKSSGGILRDMTIHDFDMARFLLGEEPDTVFATASVLVDPAIGEAGDFDSVSIVLTTASRRQCSISNSRRATYGYDQRIEAFGVKGLTLGQDRHRIMGMQAFLVAGNDAEIAGQPVNQVKGEIARVAACPVDQDQVGTVTCHMGVHRKPVHMQDRTGRGIAGLRRLRFRSWQGHMA